MGRAGEEKREQNLNRNLTQKPFNGIETCPTVALETYDKKTYNKELRPSDSQEISRKRTSIVEQIKNI